MRLDRRIAREQDRRKACISVSPTCHKVRCLFCHEKACSMVVGNRCPDMVNPSVCAHDKLDGDSMLRETLELQEIPFRLGREGKKAAHMFPCLDLPIDLGKHVRIAARTKRAAPELDIA